MLDLVPVDRSAPGRQRSRRLGRRRHDVRCRTRTPPHALRRRHRSPGSDQVGRDGEDVGRRARDRFFARVIFVSGWRGRSTLRSTIRAVASCAIGRRIAHVVHLNLGLLRALGLDAAAVEFPIDESPSEIARSLRQETGGRYALLNPGAAWPNKRWPTARLAVVAAALAERHGLRSVVIWGPGERDLARGGGRRRRRRGAAVAGDRDRGPGCARARRGGHGVRRHRSDAHCCGGRDTARRYLRSDASRAQRPLAAGGRHGVAGRRLRMSSPAPLQTRDDVPDGHHGSRGARRRRAEARRRTHSCLISSRACAHASASCSASPRSGSRNRPSDRSRSASRSPRRAKRCGSGRRDIFRSRAR